MTTLIDVLVKPYCKTYLQNAADKLRAGAGDIPFLIMQSNGGVVKHSTAGERPVTMLLSGPAAGILGSIHMAELAGYRNILTIDVGGTSTDVAIIEDFKPMYTSSSMVENYPVKTPMLDIVTVGSGGGSIAWTDPTASCKVGPQSAGADPGPICYRQGRDQADRDRRGDRPRPAAGGADRRRDQARPRRGRGRLPGARRRVRPVGGGGRRRGARDRRGEPGLRHPPGDDIARPRARPTTPWSPSAARAACSRPKSPTSSASPPSSRRPIPATSAPSGSHVSDVRRDYIRTIVRQQSKAETAEILAAWDALASAGLDDIKAEGIAEERIALHRVADVRYFGEGHEVQVDIPGDLAGDAAIAHMWSEFHKVHDRTFGFHYEGKQDVELVNLRVQAVGDAAPPVAEARRDGAQPGEAVRAVDAPIGARPAGSNARSISARTSPSDRPSTVPRSSRSTARRWSCRGAGRSGSTATAISSSRRPGEEFSDARQDGHQNQARPDRAGSDPRHDPRRRARDRGGGRAHGALADDPRPARLPRRPVRRQGPKAHRPLLFGDRRAGVHVFRRRHPAGRRVLLERPLQFRRRHRPCPGPLHHGADLLRRAADRLQPGLRPPRRRRRLGARQPARACHRLAGWRASSSRRSSSTRRAS